MNEETVYKAQEKAKLNSGSSLAPWLLIATGVMLLVAGMFDVHLLDYFWPAFVIVPGLLMLYPAYKSTAGDQSTWAFLAIPGAVFAATGALLALMNLFNHFEAWAYTWPLIAASIAGGVLYVTRFDGNERLEARAHKFIRTMVLFTAGLAVFFEIFVFQNFSPLMALGLIGFGVFLLLRDRKEARVAG
ncbi:MAG: hypothetical protein ACK2UK_11975 [Candidatus Promineifilaceae bacterium]